MPRIDDASLWDRGPGQGDAEQFGGERVLLDHPLKRINEVLSQVEGLVRLMERDEIGPINLGNPGEFTIRELAEKVIEMTGAKSRIIERPLPPDDPKQRRPDITKARAALDFQPKISLAEGLRPTVEYFRNRLAAM